MSAKAAVRLLAALCSLSVACEDSHPGALQESPLRIWRAVERWNSTERIAQLTGDVDAEGLPHVNHTEAWGVEGVDLGANTVHNGRTYIYFGDVPQCQKTPPPTWPPQDADLQAYLEDVHVPRNAHLAIAVNSDQNRNLFYIGKDGALWRLWTANGVWSGPKRISNEGIAPPGAALTASAQFVDLVGVFFVGNHGAIYASWLHGATPPQEAAEITPPSIAPAGASLAVAPRAGGLEIFVVGNGGVIRVMQVVAGQTWNDSPAAVTHALVAPPGAAIAVAWQTADQLDVFVVGDDGAVYVTWRDHGAWFEPVSISDAGLAPAGAEIAAAKQTVDLLDVFVVGHDGAARVISVQGIGVWQRPRRLTPRALARPGGSLFAAKQLDEQLDLLVVGKDGALHVTWVVGPGDDWAEPVAISPAGAINPRGSVSLSRRSHELDAFFVGVDDTPQLMSVAGSGHWSGSTRVPSGLDLTPVMSGGSFFPFRYADGSVLSSERTPTGAFSYDGRVYVFGLQNQESELPRGCGTPPDPETFRFLASSADPAAAQPFELEFRLPRESHKFHQIAPWVVKNAEVAGLPSTRGDGLVMFGQANLGSTKGQISLAWMPLSPGRRPRRGDILYYAGESASSPWSSSESDAIPLIYTNFTWTSLSVGRIAETGKWMLVYQRGFWTDSWPDYHPFSPGQPAPRDETIVARFAATPFGLSDADEIPIFDPIREEALNNYMYRICDEPDEFDTQNCHDPNPLATQKPVLDTPSEYSSFAYGAYLLNGYTEWDSARSIVTLYYLMSTGRPYQVQVMRTRVSLPERKTLLVSPSK